MAERSGKKTERVNEFEMQTYVDHGRKRGKIIAKARLCLEKDQKGLPTGTAVKLLIAWTENVLSKKKYHEMKYNGTVSDDYRAAVLACMEDKKLDAQLGAGEARDNMRKAIHAAAEEDGELMSFLKELEYEIAEEKKREVTVSRSSVSSVSDSPPSVSSRGSTDDTDTDSSDSETFTI